MWPQHSNSSSHPLLLLLLQPPLRPFLPLVLALLAHTQHMQRSSALPSQQCYSRPINRAVGESVERPPLAEEGPGWRSEWSIRFYCGDLLSRNDLSRSTLARYVV
mmetsp:Transcript_34281/g.97158  ORF Transcript_34281/g.97158 Transcript_34281/m.97158 type:complete len:105 (-) Transcript_34281:30-344(-)